MAAGNNQVPANAGRRAALVVATGLVMAITVAGCGSGSGGTWPSVDRSSTLIPATSSTIEVPTTRPDTTRPTVTLPDRVSTTLAPPTTAPPTTVAPTTAPPTTAAPTTAAPTTAPTTTAPPATTTTATSTSSTTSTSTSTTAVVTTTTPSPAPAEADDGTTWWPWALAAAVVAAVVAALVVRRRRQAALLLSQTEALLDQAEAVSQELAALDAAALHQLARPSAHRLVTVGGELASTAAATKEAATSTALTELGAEVTALHDAVDAVALDPAQPASDVIADVHARAARVHALVERTRVLAFPPAAP